MLEPCANLKPPPERFAVIADVHGNADALSAVLAEIDAAGIGYVVNLGDHLSGPLDPEGTAALLLARPEMVCIRGNHDRYLLEDSLERMGLSDRVAREAIGDAEMSWLKALPATARLGADVACVHGRPNQDDAYLMERIGDGGVSARDAGEVAAEVGETGAALVLCGHSHLPREMRVGGTLVVNPGSVGCPAYTDDLPEPHDVETGSPEACWAVIHRAGEGWEAEFRQTAYDTARMVAAAEHHGSETWAQAVATGWLRG